MKHRLLFGLLALACLTPSAWAQKGNTQQGTTTLRLDAVDVSRSPKGEFTFFASFLDKHFKAITATDPTKWTVTFDGEKIDAPLTVVRLGDSEEGVSIVIVLAMVEAILPEVIEASRKGTERLLNSLRNADRSALVVYATGPEATAGLTPTHNEAVGWLNERKQNGLQPFLFEAMEKGLDFFPMDFDSVGPNRMMLVVTDGFDNNDENASLTKDLIVKIQRLASNRNVRINVVGVAIEDPEALSNVKKIVGYTGGTYREARTPPEVEKFLGNVESEIQGQHVVKVTTTDFEDNKETAFKLSVVEQGGREYGSAAVIRLTLEKESHIWTYVIWGVGGLLGLGLLLLLFRLIGRLMSARREEGPVETGPDLYSCGGCKNMIPYDWKVCKYCEALPHLGRLVVSSSGDLNGHTYFLKESLSNIGSADGNNVVIVHPSVSKRHAGIKVQDNRFELADFGSTNGVMVNGQRITKQFLKAGDKLSIGLVELEFTLK